MRSPQPKHLDPGGLVELRMDDVHGRFVFDNGVVAMNDVGVQFRGAPVRFDHGTVVVEDTGRFDLERQRPVGQGASGSTPTCARRCRR